MKSLMPDLDEYDTSTFEDMLMISAMNVEFVLRRIGAKPGEDYNKLDLINAGMPFAMMLYTSHDNPSHLIGNIINDKIERQKRIIDGDIDCCDFSMRTLNVLKSAGIKTTRDLLRLNEKELRKIEGLGIGALREIESRLDFEGLFIGQLRY